MALDDTIRILGRVPLFSGFGREELRLLAFAAVTVTLRPGETACRKGEPADGALVLVDGVLAETDGARTVARIARASTLICEAALVADVAYPLTLTADETTRLVKLPREQFRRLLEDVPEAAEALRGHFARNLDALTKSLEAAAARIG